MNQITVREILDLGLRDFSERESAHTTGALARDKDGNPVKPTSPEATCWCSLGMLLKQAHATSLDDPVASVATDLLLAAARERGFISTSRCNDTEGRNGALFMYRRGLDILNYEGLPAQAPNLQPVGSTR